MELKERIALIIKENHFKQKEFAAVISVTEGYVSALLSGRNQNISLSVANLIEEKLGYSAKWVMTGKEPKFKQMSRNPNLSDVHRRALIQLEKMPDDQVRAVLAFIDSLDKIELALKEKSPNPEEAVTKPTPAAPEQLLEEPSSESDPPPEDGGLHKTKIVPVRRRRPQPHYAPVAGEVAAGYPILATQDYGERVRVSNDIWEPGLVALRLKGDSMEPDYPDGSYILVRPTDNVSIGDLIVAIRERDDGTGDAEATFKYLEQRNGEYVLRAINPKYKDQEWNSNNVRIFGKFIGVPDEDE